MSIESLFNDYFDLQRYVTGSINFLGEATYSISTLYTSIPCAIDPFWQVETQQSVQGDIARIRQEIFFNDSTVMGDILEKDRIYLYSNGKVYRVLEVPYDSSRLHHMEIVVEETKIE